MFGLRHQNTLTILFGSWRPTTSFSWVWSLFILHWFLHSTIYWPLDSGKQYDIQTCVQWPPLGPEKSGRMTEYPKYPIRIFLFFSISQGSFRNIKYLLGYPALLGILIVSFVSMSLCFYVSVSQSLPRYLSMSPKPNLTFNMIDCVKIRNSLLLRLIFGWTRSFII